MKNTVTLLLFEKFFLHIWVFAVFYNVNTVRSEMWVWVFPNHSCQKLVKSLVYDSWFDKSHTQFPSSQYSLITVLYKWGHATSMKGSFGCSNNIDGLCRKWPKNGFQNNSIMVSFICSLLLNIEWSLLKHYWLLQLKIDRCPK